MKYMVIKKTYEMYEHLGAATNDLMSIYDCIVLGDGVVDKVKFLEAINEVCRVEFALLARYRDERRIANKKSPLE